MDSNIITKIVEIQNVIQVHLEEHINIYLSIIIGVLVGILGINIYVQTKGTKKLEGINNGNK